jgi:hypothetical protein
VRAVVTEEGWLPAVVVRAGRAANKWVSSQRLKIAVCLARAVKGSPVSCVLERITKEEEMVMIKMTLWRSRMMWWYDSCSLPLLPRENVALLHVVVVVVEEVAVVAVVVDKRGWESMLRKANFRKLKGEEKFLLLIHWRRKKKKKKKRRRRGRRPQ